MLLTHALALSASQFVRKKKPLRTNLYEYALGGTRIHAGQPATPPRFDPLADRPPTLKLVYAEGHRGLTPWLTALLH